MTKTITVSGGFGGTPTVDITDSLGQLMYASFLIALTPVGQDDPPPVGDPAWKVATATQSANKATVSVWVDNTQALGGYNVAVDVVTTDKHEAVWATDRNGRRSLVVVT